MSGVPTGTATATGSSGPRLSLTIDGVVYASAERAGLGDADGAAAARLADLDQDLGPFFDFRVSGTLVASTGAAIGIEGACATPRRQRRAWARAAQRRHRRTGNGPRDYHQR